ncbi:dTMP kinase [Crateriforma conspicua]|uniref:dTMP kinase n=1 Tax=Crateriforma conspicua TaxID=2527996 RepID=UPI001188DB0E|nr:dTMP kinase [Crateriforma conspicua]QDV63096.1 Thymidylate kinase [Crateriforma conspicua]
MFITLDGIDGVGKSTQIARLAEHLTSLGQDVLTVRDPGSTDIGSKLRSLLLDSDLTMHRRTEAMLFMASRCEMVETIIRPALDAGRWVISDRFLLSTVVYQSVGGDVPPDLLWKLGEAANDWLCPDVTILLDMPAEASMRRLDRPADRMESRGLDYLETVRQAFLDQLPHSSPRNVVIDADRDIDAVTDDVLALFASQAST